MAIQSWSEDITVAELGDDPQFTDEVTALIERLQSNPTDVVLNFSGVGFINSSNISLLLRLRKLVAAKDCQLILCDVNSQVWGVFLVTGLDKIFDFTGDVATALASVQINSADAESES